MKITKNDLELAIAELGSLRYFPADPGTRAAIMALLARMVSSREQLRWLTQTMVDKVGEWKGPKEMRGVLCTRFKPADGIEENCEATAKFLPETMETYAMIEHDKRKAKELEAPKEAWMRNGLQVAVKRLPSRNHEGQWLTGKDAAAGRDE